MEQIEFTESGKEMPKTKVEGSIEGPIEGPKDGPIEIIEEVKETLSEMMPEDWNELVEIDKTSIVREIIDFLKDSGIVGDNPIINALIEVYESPELVAEMVGIAAKAGIILGGAYFGMDTTAIAEIVAPMIEKIVANAINGDTAIEAFGDLTETIEAMPTTVEDWNNLKVNEQTSFVDSLLGCLNEMGLSEVGQQIKAIKDLFIPELSDAILAFVVKEGILLIGDLIDVDPELVESIASQVESGINSDNQVMKS